MNLTIGVLGVIVLGQLCKKYIVPRFGDTGLHVFLFGIALMIVIVEGLSTAYPGFGSMVVTAGKYLGLAIGAYEVILKKVANYIQG